MKISVIGTGYVGLTTGTCLADMGHDVICVDTDLQKIERLRRGDATFYEPALDDYLERNIAEGRLHFSQDLRDGIRDRELIFLALPTPSTASGGADLSVLLSVAQSIAEEIADEVAAAAPRSYRVIVNKSTAPVGTVDRLGQLVERAGLSVGLDVDVVSNPEFLREGSAVTDALKPDRVVIGSNSARASAVMKRLYEPFVRQGHPILIMDPRSAEMTKYAANAFLAGRISFMNEMANLCESVGADIEQVRAGIGSDHRIGAHFLYAGLGFGGSCFPKDVRALIDMAARHGIYLQMVESILAVNRRQRAMMAHRIESYYGDLAGRHIAVWGLAFKPDTDDVREAPSHEIIQYLVDRGARVRVFDPVAIPNTKAVFGDGIEYAASAFDAAKGTDGLVICTEWHEFRRPDFQLLRSTMRHPVIFDGRNLFSPKEMAQSGFDYYSVGQAVSAADPHEEIIPGASLRLQVSYRGNGVS